MEVPLVSSSQLMPLQSISSAFLHPLIALNSAIDGNDADLGDWSSFIGIATAVVGNILISFALNTQRYAHIRINRDFKRLQLLSRVSRSPSNIGRSISSLRDQENRDDRDVPDIDAPPEAIDGRDDDSFQESVYSDHNMTAHDKRLSDRGRMSYLQSPYWWAGIILMTVGEAGNFLAYGFAPASIVSPLGVVALISNCLIAPLMLKETFRRQDFWGVTVAITGAVTIVLSAKTSETKIGPDDIWSMVTQWEFLLFLGITGSLIAILMWASDHWNSKSIFIDVGLVALFGVYPVFHALNMDTDTFLGGYTALSTKGVSSLLSVNLWHVITFPITYGLIAVLVISALMQVRYINRALQLFDSTLVIPTQFVLFTLSVITGSAILYRDFESTSTLQAVAFIGGCALTFSGVYLLTSGRAPPYSEPVTNDEEAAIGLLAGVVYNEEQRYQAQPRASQRPAGKPRLTLLSRESISRSLLDTDDLSDNGDNRLETPRAPLSPSRSRSPSPLASLSGTSSFASTAPPSPPLEPNPGLEEAIGSPLQQAPARPEYETSTAEPNSNMPSQILLQFPPPPGISEPSPQPESATAESFLSRTPRKQDHSFRSRSSASSANRRSVLLSPGPFFTPLSGGISAVIADSMRRDEASARRHNERSPSFRRKEKNQPSTRENGLGDQDAGDEANNDKLSEPAPRLNSGEFTRSSPRNNRKTAALGRATPKQSLVEEDENTTLTIESRMRRSLSDSWSGSGMRRLSPHVQQKRDENSSSPSEDTIRPLTKNSNSPTASGT